MKPSWIRRWFMKQDDFSLWAYGFVLLVVFISTTVWLLKIFIQHLFGIPQ